VSSAPILAALRGGDGPYPIDSIFRSDDGGATWYSEPTPRPLHLSGAVYRWSMVNGDGILLVDLAPGTKPVHQPGSMPLGLFRSVGGDWGSMRQVNQQPPGSLFAGYSMPAHGPARI
jgi:hypothetical protein